MRKPLAGRVDHLEQRRGPLPKPEAAELAALEAEYARRFHWPSFESWPEEKLDDYLAFQSSAAAERLDQLRQRRKPAAERARLEADLAVIHSMDRDQLDAFMATYTTDPDLEEPTPWQR